MIHHLKLYNPKNLRSEQYRNPTVGVNARAGIWGLGLEWLLPVVTLITVAVLILGVAKVPFRQQELFLGSALLWSYLMFNAIHDAMHLNRTWLLRIPFVRIWFLHARRLHDIHHVQIDSDGLMSKNFGICFFFMDRLFGTLETQGRAFDEESYRRALSRYSFIT
jgi:sterol desaturase/sphingolipid hydroxylase (fatty acid hydroxylase superfamily)